MFSVTIKEKQGTMNSELFDVMAQSGDLNPTKVSELIGEVVTARGYSVCEIKTEDNEFSVCYIDTAEFGIVSSGSEIFADSVKKYFGKVDKLRLQEIKTKKGKTYKATPVLETNQEETKQEETNHEITNEELPF